MTAHRYWVPVLFLLHILARTGLPAAAFELLRRYGHQGRGAETIRQAIRQGEQVPHRDEERLRVRNHQARQKQIMDSHSGAEGIHRDAFRPEEKAGHRGKAVCTKGTGNSWARRRSTAIRPKNTRSQRRKGSPATPFYEWVASDINFPIKTMAVNGNWSIEYSNIRTSVPDSLFEIPEATRG